MRNVGWSLGWQRKRCHRHCTEPSCTHSYSPQHGCCGVLRCIPEAIQIQLWNYLKIKKKALQQGFGQQAVFSFRHPTNKLLHGSLPLSALVPAYSCPTKPHLVRPAPSPASKAWVCHAMWLMHSTPERHSTCLQASGPPLRSHSPEDLPTWSPSTTKCLQRDSREPVKETLRKRAWLKPGPPLAFLLILKACPHSPGSLRSGFPRRPAS